MLDAEELAYLAGYLDGERCFTVGRHWKISVVCENTHRPTIDWIHHNLGGSVSSLQNKRQPQWRPTYRWSVVSNDALAVCQVVAPYLREKTEQALLLIALQLRKQPQVPDASQRQRRQNATGYQCVSGS